ncbi:MAG: PIN domain-containing protein [Candidatus Bathyarchaeota archaeon]|nr:PIN domain-containing protein [Candidatus Bathyarchaeota archaeon]
MDTRFFIESLESKDLEFRKRSRAMLDNLEGKGNLGIIPSIVILEMYKLQLEKFGSDVAELRVNSLLKLNMDIANLDSPIAVEAAKLRCRYAELPTADAIIAATGIVLGCDCVVTDDRHIRQVREVKTRWI